MNCERQVVEPWDFEAENDEPPGLLDAGNL